MNLELVRVENKVTEAIVLVDLGVDCDGALVTKLAAKFEVVKGNGVVRRFDPVGRSVSFMDVRGIVKSSIGPDEETDQAGRMSLSDAMFAKLLVTSLWQNLFWIPKAPDLAAADLGRDFNCVRGVL
jgi:hypothetical protein